MKDQIKISGKAKMKKRQLHKKFWLKMKLIILSLEWDTKNVYHREMKDGLDEIWFKVGIIGQCPKFLINIFFFIKNII